MSFVHSFYVLVPHSCFAVKNSYNDMYFASIDKRETNTKGSNSHPRCSIGHFTSSTVGSCWNKGTFCFCGSVEVGPFLLLKFISWLLVSACVCLNFQVQPTANWWICYSRDPWIFPGFGSKAATQRTPYTTLVYCKLCSDMWELSGWVLLPPWKTVISINMLANNDK